MLLEGDGVVKDKKGRWIGEALIAWRAEFEKAPPADSLELMAGDPDYLSAHNYKSSRVYCVLSCSRYTTTRQTTAE